jgi:hypothetical protein
VIPHRLRVVMIFLATKCRFFLLILSLLLAPHAGAQDEALSQADTEAIKSVIEAQLDAFARGDARRAFSYASEQIRGKFGSPENFIAMVRMHYAVVMRPASVIFLAPETHAGQTLQAVQMSDDAGVLWLALYPMQRQPDGSWRINGCVLRRVESERT